MSCVTEGRYLTNKRLTDQLMAYVITCYGDVENDFTYTEFVALNTLE